MFLTWSLVLHRSCQLLEMRWQLYRTYACFCRVLHSAYRYFKTILKEVSGSASSRQKLKPICATRWVERHDSIIIFVALLPAVVSTLDELQQENKQVDVATKAATFCTEMHVFNRGFSYATHFWYSPTRFKTAAKERIGYICCD